MSMVSAVATPVRCAGSPSESTTAHIDIDDAFVVTKQYSCGWGHSFDVDFDAPINLPVLWECEIHEVIAFES